LEKVRLANRVRRKFRGNLENRFLVERFGDHFICPGIAVTTGSLGTVRERAAKCEIDKQSS
jgi:hypothetical protein